MPASMWLADVVQVFVGAGFAIGGPIQFVNLRRAWDRRTSHAIGRVIGSETRVGGAVGHHVASNHAHVEFEVGGRRWVSVSPYGVSWSTPRVGEKRRVVYDPADPSDSEVLNELGRSIEQALLLALPVVGTGMVVAFLMRQFGG